MKYTKNFVPLIEELGNPERSVNSIFADIMWTIDRAFMEEKEPAKIRILSKLRTLVFQERNNLLNEKSLLNFKKLIVKLDLKDFKKSSLLDCFGFLGCMGDFDELH